MTSKNAEQSYIDPIIHVLDANSNMIQGTVKKVWENNSCSQYSIILYQPL